MTGHVHDWAPVDGLCSHYACECGARGRRSPGGQIQDLPESNRIWPEDMITARPIGDVDGRVMPHIPEDWSPRDREQGL